jgi:hypothetical protein
VIPTRLVATAARGFQRRAVSLGCVLAVAVAGAACGASTTAGRAATTGRRAPSVSSGAARTAPLAVPKTSPSEDGRYLADVARADATLASYVEQRGDVALRALLTDGSAFCAFLQRDRGIDGAMLSVAVGAKSVESETHLPSTVTTFNTIDAVALLTLCPAEQKLVPASDRSRIDGLGEALAK